MTYPADHLALNHMARPQLTVTELCELANRFGFGGIELRTDIGANAVAAPTDARSAASIARDAGVPIVSINALQRFNQWSNELDRQARVLSELTALCEAQFMVMCPVNDPAQLPEPETARARMRESLEHLAPIVEAAGIRALVEPLGFATSSLRTKQEAYRAIESLGLRDRFALLHDTFHHYIAGEASFYPDGTALVHISGVERAVDEPENLRDDDRVLVGSNDLAGNITQIKQLAEAGYTGIVSFEPFATEVQRAPDLEAALRTSISWIARSLSR